MVWQGQYQDGSKQHRAGLPVLWDKPAAQQALWLLPKRWTSQCQRAISLLLHPWAACHAKIEGTEQEGSWELPAHRMWLNL